MNYLTHLHLQTTYAANKLLKIQEKLTKKILTFDGNPLKILDEIRYLGFLLTKNGSWDKFFDMIIQKARGTIAQSFTLLTSEEITFKTRLR